MKKKDSIRTHAIARNTFGVWTAARQIWALSRINSHAHRDCSSTKRPTHATTHETLNARSRKQLQLNRKKIIFFLPKQKLIGIFFRTPAAKSTTVKTIFVGKPSTTTTEQPEEEIEYEDEEEEEEEQPPRPIDSKFKDALEEEDPEVIKELITLIKKVGGLDELEKQLQLRLSLNENSPIVNGGSKTTTTMSPISKSLYDKVISTRRGLPQSRKESVVGSTRATIESETEPLVQRQNKENRYSSVVRSRPRPQNDGVDKLSEIDGGGVMHERPQYVTITRTQTPRTSTATDADDLDEAEEEDEQLEDDEEEEEEDVLPSHAKTTTTHQPTHSYVNIRRSRPTSSTTERELEEDEDDSSNGKQTTRMQYVSIKRTRPSYQPSLNDEIIDATPESK